MYKVNQKHFQAPTPGKNFEPVQQYTQVKSSGLQQAKRPYTDPLISSKQQQMSPVPKQRQRADLAPVYKSATYPPESQRVDRASNSDFLGGLLTKESTLPFYEPTKCSTSRNGIIKAYAANTNQGIVRDYNEDRVSIILNIVKPQSRSNENWPKCSFFGVYDGHGGAACADFLRDNLHQFVIREPDFPWNPPEAIRKGFEAAEKHFLEIALQSYSRGVAERSGSCAIVALFIGDACYIANVGDSRAVLSAQQGKQVYTLSKDHKPSEEAEQVRIQQAGGKIYQTQACADGDKQLIVGPLRVLPGRLSVSRTFGDIEAKFEQFGGNPKVVVAEPEIRSFKITLDHDFIVLACDGIFDKMSSQDVLHTAWNDMRTPCARQPQTLHTLVSSAVEAVLKESINRRTYDNITVVMIAFGREEETRPRTVNSVERLDNSLHNSVSPMSKYPYTSGFSQRDEKLTFIRSSTQQIPVNYATSQNKLRQSFEPYDYSKKATHPSSAHSQFQYIKSKESSLPQKAKPLNVSQDDNQENNSKSSNLNIKKNINQLELKYQTDYQRQVKRAAVPMQVFDIGNHYLGRIY